MALRKGGRQMKELLTAVMLAALLVPPAYAQQSSAQAEAREYLVFFELNETTLTAEGARWLPRPLRSTKRRAPRAS
jgi:hypothetical protein